MYDIQRDVFYIPSNALALLTPACVLAVLVFSVLISIWQVGEDLQIRTVLAMASATRRLRSGASGRGHAEKAPGRDAGP